MLLQVVLIFPIAVILRAASQRACVAADASAVLANEGMREGSSAASSPTKASEASTRFQAASFNLARPPDDIVRHVFHALSCVRLLVQTFLVPH